jgi:hypothetical protein
MAAIMPNFRWASGYRRRGVGHRARISILRVSITCKWITEIRSVE